MIETLASFMECCDQKKEEHFQKTIQDDNGNWVIEKDEVERLVLGYFCNLFIDDSHFYPFCLQGALPKLADSQLETFKIGCDYGGNSQGFICYEKF